MDISAYNVRKITAEAKHRGDSHWIVLSMHEKYFDDDAMQISKATLFMHDKDPDAAAKADAYAAAINGVNEPAKVDA